MLYSTVRSDLFLAPLFALHLCLCNSQLARCQRVTFHCDLDITRTLSEEKALYLTVGSKKITARAGERCQVSGLTFLGGESPLVTCRFYWWTATQAILKLQVH